MKNFSESLAQNKATPYSVKELVRGFATARGIMRLTRHEKLELEHLEESLWKANTRFNKDYMENLLAPDFFEFGRSGKIYTRAECLDTEPQEICCQFPLKNFIVHVVGDNAVLVTYVSEVSYGALQLANRSSIWVRINNTWKLRFHQGTPFG